MLGCEPAGIAAEGAIFCPRTLELNRSANVLAKVLGALRMAGTFVALAVSIVVGSVCTLRRLCLRFGVGLMERLSWPRSRGFPHGFRSEPAILSKANLERAVYYGSFRVT
jgi:hypothetical protein